MNVKLTWERGVALFTFLGILATGVVKFTHAEDGIARNAENHRQHVERAKEGKSELKTDIKEVSGNVSKITQDVSEILQEIAGMKAEQKAQTNLILTAVRNGQK